MDVHPLYELSSCVEFHDGSKNALYSLLFNVQALVRFDTNMDNPQLPVRNLVECLRQMTPDISGLSFYGSWRITTPVRTSCVPQFVNVFVKDVTAFEMGHSSFKDRTERFLSMLTA